MTPDEKMSGSRISTRGRITIPADLRRKLGFKPGSHAEWREEEGKLTLTVLSAETRRKRMGNKTPSD